MVVKRNYLASRDCPLQRYREERVKKLHIVLSVEFFARSVLRKWEQGVKRLQLESYACLFNEKRNSGIID